MPRPKYVHQFLPDLGFRDAVGNHTLRTAQALKSEGIAGGIWSEQIHEHSLGGARDYRRFPRKFKRQTVVMYQASTGTQFGLGDFLLQRTEPLVIAYHNITPARFYAEFDEDAAGNLSRAREELKRIAARCRVALAMSEYNAAELRELGVADVRVSPPFLPTSIDAPPNPSTLEWLTSTKRGVDLLFVGRVVPNKGHLNLMRMLKILRSLDEGARLFVVGAWGPKDYLARIYRLRESLSVEGAVLTGSMQSSNLAALYRHADAFVSMSEHEGFGLPFVEAMRMKLPIIAYASSAVPETVSGAGMLVDTLDPAVFAETVVRVLGDQELVALLRKKGLQRVQEIELQDRSGTIVAAVSDALD